MQAPAARLAQPRPHIVGFRTTLIGKSSEQITYLLAWNTMAEREKRWNALLADPE
jgi:hypothetical protein